MSSDNSNTAAEVAPFIFVKFIIFLIILYCRTRRCCCTKNDDNEELIRAEGYYSFFYTNYNIKKRELKT